MSTNLLRIGQVAEAASVGVQTIRYYERRGLLEPVSRSAAGHRLYHPRTVTIVRLVKNAQRLGFSLAEVARLMRDEDGTTTAALTERRIVQIESQIADLQRSRQVLLSQVR